MIFWCLKFLNTDIWASQLCSLAFHNSHEVERMDTITGTPESPAREVCATTQQARLIQRGGIFKGIDPGFSPESKEDSDGGNTIIFYIKSQPKRKSPRDKSQGATWRKRQIKNIFGCPRRDHLAIRFTAGPFIYFLPPPFGGGTFCVVPDAWSRGNEPPSPFTGESKRFFCICHLFHLYSYTFK